MSHFLSKLVIYLITCAVCAKEHDLLALDGWKRVKYLVKHDKTLTRAIKQSKIRK